MGNDPSVSKAAGSLDHFQQQFTVKERDLDRNLMKVVDRRSGRQFIMRELTTNDDIQKKRIEDLVVEKRMRRCKYVMRLEDYHISQDKRYCLNQFKAYLLFESPFKDLKEELLQRAISRQQFHDDQLMSILESVVMGLKYFKDIGHPHEAVCCSNILISREGFIMLSDPWYCMDDTRLPKNDRVYLSPERLQAQNMNRTAKVDWYLADLWSLGMVVVEVANLKSIDGLYTKNGRQINHDLLRDRLDQIHNPTIRKYVQGLLDTEKRRIETANAIEQMAKLKKIQASRDRVLPVRPQEQVVTTTTVTNRTYTPSVPTPTVTTPTVPAMTEPPINHMKPQDHYVQPTSVLQQQQMGSIATPPMMQHGTVEFLQTRPFTNYVDNHQQYPSKQLYGQTIAPHPPSKGLYTSSSAANLHAVSPVKQPTTQKPVQSPPQQTKHNRSLTVTSKPVQPAPLTERERSNSGYKFNFPAPSAVTTSSTITSIPQTYGNPVSLSRAKQAEHPPNGAAFTQEAGGWSRTMQLPQGAIAPSQQYSVSPPAPQPTAVNPPTNSASSNTSQPLSMPTTQNSYPFSMGSPPPQPKSKPYVPPASQPTYNSSQPAPLPSFIKKVPAAESNTYSATYNASSNTSSSFGSWQPAKPIEQTSLSYTTLSPYTPMNFASLLSKSPPAEPKIQTSTEVVASHSSTYSSTAAYAPPASTYPSSSSAYPSSSSTYPSSSTTSYPSSSSYNMMSSTPAPIGLTSSMSNFTKGLSAADADLFTKPQLLREFTISSALRNTSSNETHAASKLSPIDFSELNNFKSSNFEATQKYPSPGRVNNLKEIVLGKEHEFQAHGEPYSAASSSDKYLLEYGGQYTARPDLLKAQAMESLKPTFLPASYAPPTMAFAELSTAPTTNKQLKPVLQTNPTSNPPTNPITSIEPPKPQVLEIVTTTYKDLKPEDFAPKPVEQSPDNAPKPEGEQHSTPNRRRANPNRNNSTIPQVPESEISVEEELEYVVERYEVGSRYEGYKKNGMRNGRGKFFYQDGGFYDGNWKDDKMHGEGKLFYNETKLAYEGEWYLDEFHGHGKVYNDSPLMLDHPFDYADFDKLDDFWVYYQGNLVADLKEGFGRLKLSNGELYEGEWKNDRVDGRGRFITIRGDIINGVWRQNKLMKVE